MTVYPVEPFKPAVNPQPAVFDLAPPAAPVCWTAAGPYDSPAFLHTCGRPQGHDGWHYCLVKACTRRWT